MRWNPDRSFKSASEALIFIRDKFLIPHQERLWFPSESGLLLPRAGPPFIFRGEPGGFETTIATRNRPGTFEGLCEEDRIALDRLLSSLCKRLMLPRDYSLNEVNAKAFLQHYGLPTELNDFTWWHTTALTFAVKDNAELGRICIMPVGQNVMPTPLADLSQHPWAHRAQMQQAVGVIMPPGCEDLKSPSARRRFNLTWIEFPISCKDCEFLRQKREELLSLAGDSSAGFLRHHIIEYVEANGKFSPSLTEWILDRIPMTPRYYRVQHLEPPHVVITNPSPSRPWWKWHF